MASFYTASVQGIAGRTCLIKSDEFFESETSNLARSAAVAHLLNTQPPKTLLTANSLRGCHQAAGSVCEESSSIVFQKIIAPKEQRDVVLKHSFAFFWRELILKWLVYVPVINIIWVLLISPFLALHSFLKQGKILTEQWLDYQKRLSLTDYKAYLENLSDFVALMPKKDDIQIQLQEGLTWGNRINGSIITENGPGLYQIAEELCGKLQGNENSSFFLPIGVQDREEFFPLFAVFSKKDDQWRLELHVWGGKKLGVLARAYQLSQPSGQKLTQILLALMMGAAPEKGKHALTLDLKKRIRHHNLAVLEGFFPTPVKEKQEEVNKKEYRGCDLLHEKLLLLGCAPFSETPKTHEEEKPEQVGGFVQRCVVDTFPEAYMPAKALVFLSFFKEGFSVFKEALEFLSPFERRQGLALLESELHKLMLHVEKFLKTKEEMEAFRASIGPLFKEFDQFRIGLLEGNALDRELEPSVSQSQLQIIDFTKYRIKEGEPRRESLLPLEPASCFAHTLETKGIELALGEAEEYNKKIDALIEKKDYLKARNMALSLMRQLPCPEVDTRGIFRHFALQNADDVDEALSHWQNINRFSKQCALVAKSFWECSLRLNLKMLEPAALIQMIKLQALNLKLIRLSSDNYLQAGSPESTCPKGLQTADSMKLLNCTQFDEWTLDLTEIHYLFFFHPHYRLGRHPIEEREYLPLLSYLSSSEVTNSHVKCLRMDKGCDGLHEGADSADVFYVEAAVNWEQMTGTKLHIEMAKGKKHYSLVPSMEAIRHGDKPQILSDLVITFKRLQFMTSCLISPEVRLLPCEGNVYQWLERTGKKAKEEEGDPERLTTKVIELQTSQVKEHLSKLSRLEMGVRVSLGWEIYWGTGPKLPAPAHNIEIIDGKDLKLSGISYFTEVERTEWSRSVSFTSGKRIPKGDILRRPSSTQALVGQPIVQNAILGEKDNTDLVRQRPGFHPSHHGEVQMLGMPDLTAQTEPTLLSLLLQTDPKEGINFIQRHALGSLQSVHARAIDERWERRRAENDQRWISLETSFGTTQFYHPEAEIFPTSVFNALNFITLYPHLLLNARVRETLEFVLATPLALQKSLRINPLFFEKYAVSLKLLIDKYWSDDVLVSYMLGLSEVLHAHFSWALAIKQSDEEDPYTVFEVGILPSDHQLQALTENYYTLGSRLKIGEREQTLLDWMKERLKKEASNKGAISTLLINHVRYRKNDIVILDQDIPWLGLAASFYQRLAGQSELPQFALLGNEWIEETFKPFVKQRLASIACDKNALMNAWLNLVYPDTPAREWQCINGIYLSGNYRFDPDTLVLSSTEKVKSLFYIPLPPFLAKHPHILHLFGSASLEASVELGTNPAEYLYEVTFKESKYRILYNGSTTDVTIWRSMGTERGSELWAQWVYGKEKLQTLSRSKESTYDRLIQENGIFIRDTKGWVFSHLPKEKRTGKTLTCRFNAKGNISSLRDTETGLCLATSFRDGGGFAEFVPFWPENQILAFAEREGAFPLQFYHIVTGDILRKDGKCWKLKTKAFDQEVTLISSIQPQSFEGIFLRTLKGLSSSISLLVQTSKGERKILLVPYALTRNKHSLLSAQVDTQSLPPHTSLVLHIEKGNELRGSVTPLFYLAYAYMQIKDYPRAHFYLQKAQKATRSSAKEAEILEDFSSLLRSCSAHSLRSSQFLLRAYLTLHQIKRQHFAEIVYQNDPSQAYFQNLQKIATLYVLYKKKIKEREIVPKLDDDLEIELLQPDENEQIQDMMHISLRDLSLSYRNNQKFIEEIHLPTPKSFALTSFNPKKLRSPPQALISALVVCADVSETGTQIPFSKIPYGTYPTTHILLTYFPALLRLVNTREKHQVLQYLLSPGAWTLSPTITEEEKNLAVIGEYLKLYLLSQVENKDVEKIIEALRPAISEIRNILPLVPLPNSRCLSFLIIGIHMLLCRPKGKIDVALQKIRAEMEKAVPETIKLPALLDIPLELGQKVKQAKQPITAPVTTPRALIKHTEEEKTPVLEEAALRKTAQRLSEKDPDREYSLEEVVEELDNDGYSLIQQRTLTSNRYAINHLEHQITNNSRRQVAKPQPLSIDPSLNETLTTLFAPIIASIPEDAEEGRSQEISTKVADAIRYFENEQSSAEKEENQQIKAGFAIVAPLLTKELRQKKNFSAQEIASFKKALETALSKDKENSVASHYRQAKMELMLHLKPREQEKICLLPRSLRKMHRYEDLYSDDDFIEKALHLFQSITFEAWLENDPSLATALVRFLFLKIGCDQFEKALSLLSKKNPSQEDMQKAVEWSCNASDSSRYLSKRSELSPVHRKCLLAEAFDKIILRPKQREMIEEIDQDPARWWAGRMGIGKTSYVLPIAIAILIEKGYLPIQTVPDRMLTINRNGIDYSTRRFFGCAAYELTFALNANLSEAVLSEKYLQLLRTRSNGGYVITSHYHLGLLNHQITLFKRLLRIEKDQKIAQSHRYKIYYLQKIATLIYGENKGLSQSFFFADEMDETHHISRQINLALGEKIPINQDICIVVQKFFEILLSSQNPEVLPLKEALLQGKQDGLSDTVKKTALKAVALEIKKSSWLKEELRDSYKLIEATRDADWQSYLLDEREQLPQGWPSLDKKSERFLKFFEVLGILKVTIGTNAGHIFALSPDIDFGFSNFAGYVGVPKNLKGEINGMRYGDEPEFVFFQYLSYLQLPFCLGTTGAALQFMGEELKKMSHEDPIAYQTIARSATQANLTLIDYLKTPTAWQQRFGVLRRVFGQGYFKRHKSQAEMSVQDLCYGAPRGGVSGTPNAYLLPFISHEVLFSINIASTCEVAAETMIRLALSHEEGLHREVTLGFGIYRSNQARNYILNLIVDPHTVAIINMSGVTEEGQNTRDWIRDIRSTEQGRERSYLFIDPVEETAYLWINGEPESKPLGERHPPSNTICVYAPSNVRGFDLPMGQGNVHLFLGPAALFPDIMQAIYRARQLGTEQTGYLHIPFEMAELIKKSTSRDQITYGDILNCSKEHTLQRRGNLNLKAQVKRVSIQLKGTLLHYQRTPREELRGQEEERQRDIEARVFDLIEPHLVKNKKTEVVAFYPPTRKGIGLERADHAFVETLIQTESLLKSLSEMRFAPSSPEATLVQSLQRLQLDLPTQRQVFQKYQIEHGKFLPQERMIAMPMQGVEDGANGSGSQEQVVEMQQQQSVTQTKQIEEEPDKELEPFKPEENTYSAPWTFNSQFYRFESIEVMPNVKIYFSPEAEKIAKLKPSALTHLAISDLGQEGPEFYLITNYDYQFILQKAYRYDPDFRDLFSGHIFALSSEGWRLVYTNTETSYVSEQNTLMQLVARLYLGHVVSLTQQEAKMLKDVMSVENGLNKNSLDWAKADLRTYQLIKNLF